MQKSLYCTRHRASATIPLNAATFLKMHLEERSILLFVIQEIIYIPAASLVVHVGNKILFRYVW